MKTLEFENRKVIAIESQDFVEWNINIVGEIDLLLVPKEYMRNFRETDLFKCLWTCITDKTKFVYC